MLTEQTVENIVERLKTRFHPNRIILFGSQARAEADDRSDVDLLVIVPLNNKKRRSMMVEMLRALNEMEYAFDVIILTREEFERDRNIPGTVARFASREGKVLYESA